jgi:thiosulfate dehydrogenase [quinone] large subunit
MTVIDNSYIVPSASRREWMPDTIDLEPTPRHSQYAWAMARITLGFVFAWSFVDKLFGLGFATESESAWINGGSPTTGFLRFGAQGPLKDFYTSMAGQVWADWLFMAGLAGLGIALIFGIGLRIAAVSGSILMLMLWGATFQPERNPVVDEHIMYAIVLVGLALVRAGDTLGLGRRWSHTTLVRRHRSLV